MKTSDEIKRGLEIHSKDDEGCYGLQCPFFNVGLGKFCTEVMAEEALTLIRQLEQQNAEQAARLEQVTRERDAAISDLAIACHDESCEVCAHYKFDDYYITDRCELEMGECEFVWRGVPKEEE